MKNNKEINSQKATEGTLMKLFGFKRVDGDLELKIKGKDFNILFTIENLSTIYLDIQNKKTLQSLEISEFRFNFVKIKQLVTRYKTLE